MDTHQQSDVVPEVKNRVPLALGEPDSHGLTSGQIRQRGQHQGAGQLHVVKGVVPLVKVAMLDGRITRAFDALLPALRDQAGGTVARLRRRGGSGCPGGRLGRRRLLATLANCATEWLSTGEVGERLPAVFSAPTRVGASWSAQTARPRAGTRSTARTRAGSRPHWSAQPNIGGPARAVSRCVVFWVPSARPLQNAPANSVTAVASNPLSVTAITDTATNERHGEWRVQVIGERQRHQGHGGGHGDRADRSHP